VDRGGAARPDVARRERLHDARARDEQFVCDLADWLFGPDDPKSIITRILSRTEFIREFETFARSRTGKHSLRNYGIRNSIFDAAALTIGTKTAKPIKKS